MTKGLPIQKDLLSDLKLRRNDSNDSVGDRALIPSEGDLKEMVKLRKGRFFFFGLSLFKRGFFSVVVELNYCNYSKKKKGKRRTRREKRRKEEKKGRKREAGKDAPRLSLHNLPSYDPKLQESSELFHFYARISPHVPQTHHHKRPLPPVNLQKFRS